MLTINSSRAPFSYSYSLTHVVGALGLFFIGISLGASLIRFYEVDLGRDLHWLTNLAWMLAILMITVQQILLRKKRRNGIEGSKEKLVKKITSRPSSAS